MFGSMFGGKRRRSRKRRSRRRRRSGGNLVKCMAKCRDDAAKSGHAANDMKNAIKGVAAKPLAKKMSALNKYATAEKQRKLQVLDLRCKKAIAAGRAAAAGPARDVHALRKTVGGKRKRRRRSQT